MSKGIIMVEVPERCEDCLFSGTHPAPLSDHTFCRILMRGVVQKGKKKPDWCLICPIIEEKDMPD